MPTGVTGIKALWNDSRETRERAVEKGTCRVCAGPCSGNNSSVCCGCGRAITGLKDWNDGRDTKEADVWHVVGARPEKPEDVEVGQAWVYEPFPGEATVWIVKEREDGELGPYLQLKRYAPPAPVTDEQFARAMLEDGDWKFLRHGYPLELPEMAVSPDELSDANYEPDPTFDKETFPVGSVWKMVRSLSEGGIVREPGEWFKVDEVSDIYVYVSSPDGRQSTYGYGLTNFAKRMRKRERDK